MNNKVTLARIFGFLLGLIVASLTWAIIFGIVIKDYQDRIPQPTKVEFYIPASADTLVFMVNDEVIGKDSCTLK